jgi:hypothetical protein
MQIDGSFLLSIPCGVVRVCETVLCCEVDSLPCASYAVIEVFRLKIPDRLTK